MMKISSLIAILSLILASNTANAGFWQMNSSNASSGTTSGGFMKILSDMAQKFLEKHADELQNALSNIKGSLGNLLGGHAQQQIVNSVLQIADTNLQNVQQMGRQLQQQFLQQSRAKRADQSASQQSQPKPPPPRPQPSASSNKFYAYLAILLNKYRAQCNNSDTLSSVRPWNLLPRSFQRSLVAKFNATSIDVRVPDRRGFNWENLSQAERDQLRAYANRSYASFVQANRLNANYDLFSVDACFNRTGLTQELARFSFSVLDQILASAVSKTNEQFILQIIRDFGLVYDVFAGVDICRSTQQQQQQQQQSSNSTFSGSLGRQQAATAATVSTTTTAAKTTPATTTSKIQIARRKTTPKQRSS